VLGVSDFMVVGTCVQRGYLSVTCDVGGICKFSGCKVVLFTGSYRISLVGFSRGVPGMSMCLRSSAAARPWSLWKTYQNQRRRFHAAGMFVDNA